jgi:hypothetical protein
MSRVPDERPDDDPTPDTTPDRVELLGGRRGPDASGIDTSVKHDPKLVGTIEDEDGNTIRLYPADTVFTDEDEEALLS